MKRWRLEWLLGFLLGAAACVRMPPPAVVPLAPAQALTPVSFWETPAFEDDADTASLRFAAAQSLAFFEALPPAQTFAFGSMAYSASEMADSMRALIAALDQAKTPADWRQAIRQNFNVYQSFGADSKRTVTFSSYYEPTIEARLTRDRRFHYPIYGRPDDLVDVDLGQFDPRFQGARISGRREGKNLIPYYTREDIDRRKVLKIKGRVLAWAKDPVEVFFLQIEGSGWLDLGHHRRRRIRYDGDNSRPYASVGQYLISTGRIAKGGMSHDAFHRYLNDHPDERQALLDVDPRYIFFRIDISTMSPYAVGNIDAALTPERSIAVDPKLFPKGALAWMETDHPVFNEDGVQVSTVPLRHFVLAQDEGGAIQGPGRVDYFVGSGRKAELFATHFWQKGKLYFLIRKKPSSAAKGSGR